MSRFQPLPLLQAPPWTHFPVLRGQERGVSDGLSALGIPDFLESLSTYTKLPRTPVPLHMLFQQPGTSFFIFFS